MKPPPEIAAVMPDKGGRKTSVYLRTNALRMLTKASKAWKVPLSAIMNVAVLRYLSRRGF